MKSETGSKKMEQNIEKKTSPETGKESFGKAAEAVTKARQEMIQSQEILKQPGISPESKKNIRTKIDSLKQMLARLGAVLALSLPGAMVGHISYVEANRSHGETDESTAREVHHREEETAPAPYSMSSMRPLDPEAQIVRNMLLELAQTLQEHEHGINPPPPPSEIGRLTAETAIADAREALGPSPDGSELSQYIRNEIMASCSAPECSVEDALRAASESMRRMLNDATVAGDIDTAFDIASEVRTWSDINENEDVDLAAYSHRSDLLQRALRQRMDIGESEERTRSILSAIVRMPAAELTQSFQHMPPDMQAMIRNALANQEQSLNNERATLYATLSAHRGEAMTPELLSISNRLHRLNSDLSAIRERMNTLNA